jgi:phage-related protein
MFFPGINLSPGDVLRIDTSTKTITLNGENAYHLMNGVFFMLSSGENEIEFAGDGSAKIKVLHRERYI